MLPRIDSASQAQGSGRFPRLRKTFSIRASVSTAKLLDGDDAEGLGNSLEETRHKPNSPMIAANWPKGKDNNAKKVPPKAVMLPGNTRPDGPDNPLINVMDELSVISTAATVEPSRATAKAIASEKVGATAFPDIDTTDFQVPPRQSLNRTDSNDSISRILYPPSPKAESVTAKFAPETPLEAFCEFPSVGGNPFSWSSAGARSRQGQLSLPVEETFNQSEPLPGKLAATSQIQAEVGNIGDTLVSFALPTGALRTAYSTDVTRRNSSTAGSFCAGWSAPLPESWLSPSLSDIPAHGNSRTLSRGQSSILDGSWCAMAANVDPCAEVLVNSFAEFSKDMILPEVQRTPMKLGKRQSP